MLVSELERIRKENDNWELRKSDTLLKACKKTKCTNKMPIMLISYYELYIESSKLLSKLYFLLEDLETK